MRQTDLNRAVAHATGESISMINHLGFQVAGPTIVFDNDSDDRPPSVVDWDVLQAIQASNRHWSPTLCFAK